MIYPKTTCHDGEVGLKNCQNSRIWLSNAVFDCDFDEISSSELHHFSDASQKGYGAVSYLKIVDKRDKVHCSFVMGKSSLAPLKAVTIPRMELSAADVATRLDQIIRSELETKIDRSYFWTDSTCVLRYVYNEATRFQTFVANRITKIRELFSPSQWRYVDTQIRQIQLMKPQEECLLIAWDAG